MKFATMILKNETRSAAVVVADVKTDMVGTGVHASGKVMIVYEATTTTGAPDAEVAALLREMAADIDKGGREVILVPQGSGVPEAKA